MDEKKKRIHQKLLTDISDEIPPYGQAHESLKALMKSYVPAGLLEGNTLLKQFEALSRKGHLKPGKYDILESICKESGNENLVEKIEIAKEEMNLVQTEEQSAGSSTNSRKRVREDSVVSDSPKRQKTDDVMKFYPKRGNGGLMLILNSREDREGTDKDVENMKVFFKEKLHYTVHDPRSHEDDDFTTEQLDDRLKEIRNLLNGNLGKEFDCFLCVILSHGNENGIKTKDGFKNVEDIRREFNNHEVPTFTGRPKVFLIQACRGGNTQGNVPIDLSDDEPVTSEMVVDESDVTVRVPTDADTLLAFSTTPGHRSFRRKGIGSWFITVCMRVFEKYYQEEHLEDMLITVRNHIAHSEEWTKGDGGKQMPCVWSTLTRRLML